MAINVTTTVSLINEDPYVNKRLPVNNVVGKKSPIEPLKSNYLQSDELVFFMHLPVNLNIFNFMCFAVKANTPENLIFTRRIENLP